LNIFHNAIYSYDGKSFEYCMLIWCSRNIYNNYHCLLLLFLRKNRKTLLFLRNLWKKLQIQQNSIF